VCRLGEGAEVLQASSGARLTTVRVGHRVSSAAVSATAAVLGCTDRTLVLLDRRGATRAQGRAPAKVEAVGVSNAGAVFARLADGTVRAFTVPPVADRSGGARTPPRLRVLRGDAG
jgi:hypothetical protein